MAQALIEKAAYPPTAGGLYSVYAIPLAGQLDEAYWLQHVGGIAQLNPAAALALAGAPALVLAALVPLAAPRVLANQFPPLLAALAVAAAVIMPVQTSLLEYLSYKRNRDTSLRGVVCFRERLTGWQYLFFAPLLIALGLFSAWLLGPLEQSLHNSLFAGLPAWAQMGHLQADGSNNLFAFGMAVLIGGMVLPAVEELFYRGYLLPRMARFGAWAPLVNAALSTLGGLFVPWQVISRFVVHLAVAQFAWEKKNIHIGMLVRIVLGIAWAAGLMLA